MTTVTLGADMPAETLILTGARVKAESVLAALAGGAAVLDGCIASEVVVPTSREGISRGTDWALALQLVILNQASGTFATALRAQAGI